MKNGVIQRVHAYLGLFLVPWMVVYALSTIVMSHREFFGAFSGGGWRRFVTESETTPSLNLPPGADNQVLAEAILKHLRLDGPFNVRGGQGGSPLIINRGDPITPRRITYDPATGRLLVERQRFSVPALLAGLHTRYGYRQNYVSADLWGFTVDLSIAAMIIWVLSGLWTWWKIKSARLWGLAAGFGGVALFAFFLAAI